MALAVLWPWSWMLTVLVILATVCIGLAKGLFTLPIIGDGILLARGPRDFLLDRWARHGDFFTITMMGTKQTVVNSPEAIKFVLSTGHESFAGGYSKQLFELLGQGRFVGPGHSYFRKLLINATSGDGLQKLIPFVSSLAEKTVKSWENQAVVNTSESLKKFSFAVGMHAIWQDIEPMSEEMDQIMNQICKVTDGLVVLPINLPGFSYHKALKTRKDFVSRILRTIAKRREAGYKENDVLNLLMSQQEFKLTDYDLSCLMLSMLFSSFVSTSALIPWVLKYLHDFPEVLKRVEDEQASIPQKMVEDKTLTWLKPKNIMPYTLQVTYECLRIEALVPFLPRQANKDIDYNGVVFRKDSSVWTSLSSLHFNPQYYPNPWEFDPSRFEEKPRVNTFMPFGQGPHLCPGSELALTETLFIVHHLVTNYSWERCGPNQAPIPFPVRKPGGGFPIRLVKR